jgi:hypothetical protein
MIIDRFSDEADACKYYALCELHVYNTFSKNTFIKYISSCIFIQSNVLHALSLFNPSHSC